MKMLINAMRKIKTMMIALAILTLTACASIPQDGGVSHVQEKLDRVYDEPINLPVLGEESLMSRAQIEQILSQPVSLKDAERLSIEVNPMVKVKLGQVGIAEADYAQAGRIENPSISYERYSSDDYSASVLFDIGGVFLMPLKRKLEARKLENSRYQAAADVMAHIGETRNAWINAVAERHQTELVARALQSVETSHNLIRQMSALGHSGMMEASQSELILSELKTRLTRQRLVEGAARENLIRQLGLWGSQARALQIPNRLPKMPKQALKIEAVEQQAIAGRLDVQMAKFNLEGMAANLKLTRLNPFLSALELGPATEAADGHAERGFEIELRLPIFDAGGIQSRKVKIMFQQAQAQAEFTVLSAASLAREALAAYRSSWEIARHIEDRVIPIRRSISAQQLLQYNGMLISVFDLLNDLRDATMTEAEYVNALRDFWLADSNLQQALTGAGGSQMNFASGMNMAAGDDGGGAQH